MCSYVVKHLQLKVVPVFFRNCQKKNYVGT